LSFNVQEFRKGFPQLERSKDNRPSIYFDSGASSLKHRDVSDRINTYNRFETGNVHRGAHEVSRMGTENYEKARESLKEFIQASSSQEIIFTRGTTESINFVAAGLREQIKEGDEILITPFEHHSNIVPWQDLCQKTGAKLVVAPFHPEKGMGIEGFKGAITDKTRLASFIHYSNSFGNRLPIEAMLKACRERNVLTLVDGAQVVLTERMNVQKLDCDFYTFSGHKMFGPYGIGILYMSSRHLESFPPYQTGGSMIDRVTFDKTTYAEAPQKFEAGTPNISGAIGLGVAADILLRLDWESMHTHVNKLRQKLLTNLQQRDFLDVYNFESSDYTGVVSMNVKGSHPSDVGVLLDRYGFAVRAGHHCTQPLMDLLSIPGTVRVTLAPYNNEFEVDSFLETIDKVQEFF
jgi:cysteine desulfurase/selenocysteine lyase